MLPGVDDRLADAHAQEIRRTGTCGTLPAEPDQPARPLSASLRWGLGWTVIAATLAAAGCASATSVDDPADIDHTTVVSTTIVSTTVVSTTGDSTTDDSTTGDSTTDDSTTDDYASCVAELGGSPDAIEHHIDACEVARRAR